MESIFVRYRNLLVLLAILVAQLIGLAMQVRRTGEGRSTLDPSDGSGVRLIRLWANALVSPPERLIHSSSQGAGSLWQNYIDLRHVRRENQDLQQTIDRLRLEQASLLEDARQGQRLQELLNFQEKYIYKTVAAQAIGSSGSQQSRVFYIDKGADDGLARDNAVITADGIVGKVRDVFPHTAQVLAVNDQTSGAGVILETTRIRGILRGDPNGLLEIIDILADKRIFVVPDILANSGGVTASYFEWVQDRQGYFWKEAIVIEQLESILREAFDDVVRYSEAHNVNNRIAAYMLAIDRVAFTIKQRGIYA